MKRDHAVRAVEAAIVEAGLPLGAEPTGLTRNGVQRLIVALETLGVISLEDEPDRGRTEAYEIQWCFPTRFGDNCPPILERDLRATLDRNGYDLVKRETTHVAGEPVPAPKPLMPEAARRALASMVTPPLGDLGSQRVHIHGNLGFEAADHIATRLAVYGFKIVEVDTAAPSQPADEPYIYASNRTGNGYAEVTVPSVIAALRVRGYEFYRVR